MFGAASRGKRALNNLIEIGANKNNIIFCDNDKKKWGTKISGIKIISPIELEKKSKNITIIITSNMKDEITDQLCKLGFKKIIYIYELLYKEQILEKYDKKFLKNISGLKDRCFLDSEEKFTLYSSMIATSKLPGNIAEVGVYKGGSAKLLCEMKNNKKIFLFDTFEGLPQTTKKDNIKSGWLSYTSLESVKKYLKNYNSVYFYKGFFPNSAKKLKKEKFCLVHLDTDLYQSTLDSLKFFWPKLVKGGRIISHDYNVKKNLAIKTAFQEFFKKSPEKMIEIADSQVMIIK